MDIQQLLQQIFGNPAALSPNLLVNPGQTQARVPNMLGVPQPQALPQDQFGSRFAGVPPQPAPVLPPPVSVNDHPVAQAQPDINDKILGGIFAPPGTPQPQGAALSGYFPPAPSAPVPGVDTMTTGAVPQQQPPVAPSAAPRGVFGGLASKFTDSGFKDRLGDMMLGWGMGGTPQESLAMGNKAIMAGNLTRKEKAKQNQTIEYLKSKGMSDEEATATASNPTILADFLKQMRDQNDPKTALEFRKLAAEVNNAENPASKLTTDEREYQRAKGEGFTGSFMDFQKTMKEYGRNQINIDTGVKLPTGFRWKDPNDQNAGVEPIPGGPGEQIPAESAARIGMADSFLGQFDRLKEKVSSGQVTGPVDRFEAGYGHGAENETYRQIQSGTDALQRMLTGAGMPQSEAEAYANRYLPTYRDNATSATSKLEQLKRELEATKTMVMRGRGGLTAPPADTNNDPLGIR